MPEPIVISTESGVTLRITRLPAVNITLPTGPLGAAGAQRAAFEVAKQIESRLTRWFLDELPEPRPFRKEVDHDGAGRITAVRERAADPSKLATAKALSWELLIRYYAPGLVHRIRAACVD
jgi:hypothetical protein